MKALPSVLRIDLPGVTVALALVLSAYIADTAGAIKGGIAVNWFDPLLLYLGLFWVTISTLFEVLRSRRTCRESILLRSTWSRAISSEVPVARVVSYVIIGLVLVPFMSAFAALKRSIPTWKPFMFDEPLHRIDLLLHGGSPAWQTLRPIVEIETAIIFIDWVYYLWFPVVLITVSWFAWSRSHAIRTRFFTTYFLSWSLLGVGLATAFSSAGPCYYHLVVSSQDPYRDLLAALHEAAAQNPLTALQIQDYLWIGYSSGAYIIEGISAMPSMHVSVATLLFLAMRRVNRAIGYGYLCFLLLILVGSVALGWHYAVDGYVGILATSVIWWLTKPLESAVEQINETGTTSQESPRHVR